VRRAKTIGALGGIGGVRVGKARRPSATGYYLHDMHALEDAIGSVRVKGANTIDNVQTNELQHLAFERALHEELLRVHVEKKWKHPAGSTDLTRWLKYWLGVLGPLKYEAAYVQPPNDLLGNLGSTWFSPTTFFNAIFAQIVTAQAMASPTSNEQRDHWAWTASTCLYCICAPVALVNVPLLIIQNHALAASPRERLRGLIATNRVCIGNIHAVSVHVFECFFMGTLLRLYAMYATEGSSGLQTAMIVGSYLLGCLVVLILSYPTMKLFFSVWQPWEEAAQTIIDDGRQAAKSSTATDPLAAALDAELNGDEVVDIKANAKEATSGA